jgi:hypothetical protein
MRPMDTHFVILCFEIKVYFCYLSLSPISFWMNGHLQGRSMAMEMKLKDAKDMKKILKIWRYC